MSTPADQIITALRAGHEELAALVRDLKEDDLLRPSGASEWQVSQVLSHLGSGAEINLATLDAARSGAPGPDGDFNRGVWARWDAMSPAEHAAGFLATNERLVEAYEALDAETRASHADRPRLPAGAGRRGHRGPVPAQRVRPAPVGRRGGVQLVRGGDAGGGGAAARPDRRHAGLDQPTAGAGRPGGHSAGPAARARADVRAAAGREGRRSSTRRSSPTGSWSPRPRRGCGWPPAGWVLSTPPTGCR